jgi:hypothetical protein
MLKLLVQSPDHNCEEEELDRDPSMEMQEGEMINLIPEPRLRIIPSLAKPWIQRYKDAYQIVN